VILILRVLFAVAVGGVLFAYSRIVEAVAARRAGDARVIWVKEAPPPSLAAMFGGGGGDAAAAVQWKPTTYAELEKKKAETALQAATMNPLVNFAMSCVATASPRARARAAAVG
jgi:hypothetical protein